MLVMRPEDVIGTSGVCLTIHVLGGYIALPLTQYKLFDSSNMIYAWMSSHIVLLLNIQTK